ncbi:MAG: hypothetical protein GVY18_10905 [Bacteroidetes bacterium]|nr:hypothetical protein [Bacteroidota bacterium]
MRLALYTTAYPGAEAYLPDWHRSVRAQTDAQFDVWIGLDALTPADVAAAVGEPIHAEWVAGAPGDTPTQVRQRALLQIIDRYEAVVLVDCDDVLHPSRIAAARRALRQSDLAGCAQRLVDEQGTPLGAEINLPAGMGSGDVLPQHNVFGFSSSAYRSELLRACLPVPVRTVHLDWLLATRAWVRGARLSFDRTPRMDYRQHAAGTMGNRPPFSIEQVRRDARRARAHFRLVRADSFPGAIHERWRTVERVADSVERFCERVVAHPGKLRIYVRRLNTLDLAPVWWIDVAHPRLSDLWTTQREVQA